MARGEKAIAEDRSGVLQELNRSRGVPLGIGILCAFLLVRAVPADEALRAIYGAYANPTGNPIGGGKGYNRILTKGDFTVSNAEELLAALRSARKGQVV